MLNLMGISSSPREAATEYSLEIALDSAEKIPEIETEMVLLRERELPHCIHCDACIRADSKFCLYNDNNNQELYERFYEADGYLIASPVYTMNVNAQLAAFLNLLRPAWNVMINDPSFFWDKAGAALAVGGTRHGGQETTISSIHGFYHTHGINVVGGGGAYNGGTIWSKGSQDTRSEAKEDEAGLKTVRAIGKRLAVAIYQLQYGQEGYEDLIEETDLSMLL